MAVNMGKIGGRGAPESEKLPLKWAEMASSNIFPGLKLIFKSLSNSDKETVKMISIRRFILQSRAYTSRFNIDTLELYLQIVKGCYRFYLWSFKNSNYHPKSLPNPKTSQRSLQSKQTHAHTNLWELTCRLHLHNTLGFLQATRYDFSRLAHIFPRSFNFPKRGTF